MSSDGVTWQIARRLPRVLLILPSTKREIGFPHAAGPSSAKHFASIKGNHSGSKGLENFDPPCYTSRKSTSRIANLMASPSEPVNWCGIIGLAQLVLRDGQF